MLPHKHTSLAITVGAILFQTACTMPESAEVWQPDWDAVLQREAERDASQDISTPEIRSKGDPATDDLMVENNTIALTVEQAVLTAVRRNRELAVSSYTPVIAGTFELLEQGAFDPELFADFTYNERTTSEVDRGTSSRYSVDRQDSAGSLGVRQTLPTGTDVEVSLSQDRDISNRSPEQQEARVGLTVTQQLLQGFGPAVNLARIRQARSDTIASRFELRGFIESLVAQTETAYWNYVLSTERIRIFERSLELARRQLEDVELSISVGVLADSEAAAARAEVAFREQDLIDARSDQQVARLNLLRLINPPHDNPLEMSIEAQSLAALEPMPVNDIEERLQLADQMRPDLNEARTRLESDRLETIVTRNGLLPRLEVFAALGKSGFDDTFTSSFERLGEDAYDASIGLQFSKIIGNDRARGLDLAARSTRRQSAAAVENLRQLVRLQVLLAANELQRARQQIDASARARQLQERTEQAERDRFEAGASTALLVAQAQRDLVEAEIAEVEAVIAYRIARIRLFEAEGSLLDRRGLQMTSRD